MNKFITIAIFSAATAALSGCGGKEEEISHSVEDVKKMLIGTWGSPSFSFPYNEVPEIFYNTTCDTLTSPEFKPFNYNKTDAFASLNEPLFNHLLTSIKFSDSNTASDEVNITLEFRGCNVIFTEKFKLSSPTSSNDTFVVYLDLGVTQIARKDKYLHISSSYSIDIDLYFQD